MCAEVRKWKARILIEAAKEKLKTLLVNFRSGAPTIFLGRSATGLTISSKEIANEAQANLKPLRDLALRALTILIRMDDPNSYVF